MLRKGLSRVSSDRLQRVRDIDLIKKTSLPRSSLPENSITHEATEVNRREWCLFNKLTKVDPMTPPCLIGRVKMFTYMNEKTKKETCYSNKFAYVKDNRKPVGVLCDWYALNEDGLLVSANSGIQGFLAIEQYDCTLKRPLHVAGELIVHADVFSKIRAKCATKQQHDHELNVCAQAQEQDEAMSNTNTGKKRKKRAKSFTKKKK
ncbi:hypothetical protein QAD02_007121 [Eretmocerus hayati]|uniref:Uncharacterized protein n=1 Tax=Eretmocerus hayati TaxID=131215 RepID=A0ACC2N331_9HYME|nr:hypothetical protein QAD02_007121 [Eretmocerus hayati]